MTSVDAFLFANAKVILDVIEYCGYLLTIAGLGVTFMVGVKYIKKIQQAA